jgi:hypothetical protein
MAQTNETLMPNMSENERDFLILKTALETTVIIGFIAYIYKVLGIKLNYCYKNISAIHHCQWTGYQRPHYQSYCQSH